MGEEELGRVVDDDRLVSRNEEAVWEAVVGWMASAGGAVRWRGLPDKIRFPLLREEYLRGHVAGMVDGEDGEWMARVVAEALRAKAARRKCAMLELELPSMSR